ncbi:MAG: hypothetical protein FK730_04900 [Asgard group archaeon]|nr:hypothetical protein [Asgard group archaeon]
MLKSENNENLMKFLLSLKQIKSTSDANKLLLDHYNINYLFNSMKEVQEFYVFFTEQQNKSSIDCIKNKEWGDVQTPISFTKEIYQILKSHGFKPDVLIEPTMGSGNFIISASDFYPDLSLIYGVEIQKKHIWNFFVNFIKRKYTNPDSFQNSGTIFHIKQDDIFKHNFLALKNVNENKKILIIGNPPWITNAELSIYQSENLPIKSNIKNFRGLDALTGKSNFDITESIIIRLFDHFKNHQGKIVLLCKDIVIKNLIKEIPKKKYSIINIKAMKFNSQKIFKKTCNASLLICDLSKDKSDSYCSIYLMDNPNKTISRFGWINNKFASNIDQYLKYQNFDGMFSFTWRQGVKHDCSKVLELVFNEQDNLIKNKLGEHVDVEPENIFPLLKGSDLRKHETLDTKRRILLTQAKLSEEISKRLNQFPLLKKYLIDHQLYFQKRKSKIYKNKSDFAIFGIGKYTFAPYKVAIAAMYKEPIFTLIKPINNEPVIFDDTCYFVGFENLRDAVVLTYALNSNSVLEFLDSIAFKDSKRPYTKEVLMRFNLLEILNSITIDDFNDVSNRINLSIDNRMNYQEFKQRAKMIKKCYEI